MRQLRTTSPATPCRKTAASLKPTQVETLARRTCFFDLPAEIRNAIYELDFTDLYTVYPKPTPSNKEGRAIYPGVIMASRQTYSESILLYYFLVSLHFEVTDRMLSVLRKLGARKRALLKEDVFFVSQSVVEVASPQDFPRLVACVNAQIPILQRRLRDYGASLKPGVLKIIIRCWWCEETEERVYLLWLNKEGKWSHRDVLKLRVTKDNPFPGGIVLY